MKERPRTAVTAVGGGNPSLFELVLFFEGVDSILALDVGAAVAAVVAVGGVDGGRDLVPVGLAEVAAAEGEVAGAPGVDEGERGLLRPAVLPAGERRRPRRRRKRRRGVGGRRSSDGGVHGERWRGAA